MSQIDLLKAFRNEDAETFNKISKGYSMGRKDGARVFAEWCKTRGYGCYDWRMLIEQYEKEQKGGTE